MQRKGPAKKRIWAGLGFFEGTVFGVVERETRRTSPILGGPFKKDNPHLRGTLQVQGSATPPLE